MAWFCGAHCKRAQHCVNADKNGAVSGERQPLHPPVFAGYARRWLLVLENYVKRKRNKRHGPNMANSLPGRIDETRELRSRSPRNDRRNSRLVAQYPGYSLALWRKANNLHLRKVVRRWHASQRLYVFAQHGAANTTCTGIAVGSVKRAFYPARTFHRFVGWFSGAPVM